MSMTSQYDSFTPDELTPPSDPQSQQTDISTPSFSSFPSSSFSTSWQSQSQAASTSSSQTHSLSLSDRQRELNAERWIERRARRARQKAAAGSQSQTQSQSPSSGSSLGHGMNQLSLASSAKPDLASSTAALPADAPSFASPRDPSDVPAHGGTDVEMSEAFPHDSLNVLSPPSTSPVRADVEMDDDDDDAFLRRLMAQGFQMRQQPNVPATKFEDPTPAQAQHDTQAPAAEPNGEAGRQAVEAPVSGKKRAIEFLEALFLGFLDDMAANVIERNRREMNPVSKKGKKGATKRKLDDEDEAGEEDSQEGDSSQDSAPQADGIDIKLKSRTNGEERVLHFPEDPRRDSTEPVLLKQTRVLRVAACLYEALLEDCVTTKRDIYYKDVQLFGHQRVVDGLVDDIVATAGLRRQDFNVCATSKGLIASPALRIHLKSGEQLALSATNAALIPPIERIARVEATRPIDWVLIVEKDAVFTTLLGLKLLDYPDVGSGVLITGKGQPDLATRQLCQLIATTYPDVPFHGLMDADPHGIDILHVYRQGSRANQHSRDHIGLGLGDRLRWMGVKASQWLGWGVRHDELLHLSDLDVKLAMAMLKRPDLPHECKRELQNMLHLNRKAEIQIISSTTPPAMLTESLFGNGTSQAQAQTSTTERRGGLLEFVIAGLGRAQSVAQVARTGYETM